MIIIKQIFLIVKNNNNIYNKNNVKNDDNIDVN